MDRGALPFDPERFEAIVREAGALALRDFREGRQASTRSWSKNGGSPVSDADLAVDRLLRERLGALLPQAGWLSEETADDPSRLDCPLVWIVDPIDGTRAFLKGRDSWCISVALVEKGRPSIAALHAPRMGQYFSALPGQGATMNGQRISASSRAAMEGARKPAYKLHPDESALVAVSCPNSIALRIAMVANDEADVISTTRWGFEWDIAAAHLIAEEAGAKVTDIAGHAIRFNQPKPEVLGVLAAAPGIHSAICEMMAPHLPDVMRRGDEDNRC